MSWMPCAWTGMISSRSLASGRAWVPNICATDGPYRSQSHRPTFAPPALSATARLAAMVDFPTPPLPEATAMMRFTPGIADLSCSPPCPPVAGTSLTAISTLTVPTSGSASSTAWQSRNSCSGTLASRVCTSMRTVVRPASQRMSFTRPKETMSREKPG